MAVNPSEDSIEVNQQDPYIEAKKNITCKDGFCSLPDLNNNGQDLKNENIIFFDPL